MAGNVAKSADAAWRLALVAVACFGHLMAVAGAEGISEQCTEEFQKLTGCLGYATGKADAPTKECCSAVTQIKGDDPACLCSIIQQINGDKNPDLQNMGIQKSRLLLLPSACKLANASVADCPKLLHIPPGSPDYAIFTNASSATPSPTTASPTTTVPSGSSRFAQGLELTAGPAVAIAISVLVFPYGPFYNMINYS